MATLRNDLGLYERHAHDWWDARSAFAGALHEMNAVAIAQVHARFGERLDDVVAIDLGCGGGIVAEPLARAGALVVGIDLGMRTLRVAAAHGAAIAGLAYLRADAVHPPLAANCADLVVCADALEHIPDWNRLVAEAARLLVPGGRFYVLTLNRTWRARWLGVHLVEALRLVPRGTHDADLFVRPQELATAATAAGLQCEGFIGLRPRWWRSLTRWRVALKEGGGLAIAYSAWFAKPSAREAAG